MSWNKPEAAPLEPLDTSADVRSPTNDFIAASASPFAEAPAMSSRTLQRYPGGPNGELI